MQQAGAHLAAAARLQVVMVEAAWRRRAREAGWGVAAAQTAASSAAAAVLVAGRRGADGALQGGGAAGGHAGAAVVVRRAGQAADALPGAVVLGRGSVVKGGASRAVHQVSDARQEVRVAVAASSNAVTSKPGDGRVKDDSAELANCQNLTGERNLPALCRRAARWLSRRWAWQELRRQLFSRGS